MLPLLLCEDRGRIDGARDKDGTRVDHAARALCVSAGMLLQMQAVRGSGAPL